MRRLVPLILLGTLSACPSYDRYPYVASDDGLVSADEWAKWGPEQAMAVAIGRQFGSESATAAVEYSRKFADIKSIEADSAGQRLVVTFKSGWATQVTPLTDGTPADETPGLPAAK
jgi:hypothetical protein